MIVKCPKCRFHFDVPTWPGATQLQCNCARCGTPFTYTIADEEPTKSTDNKQDTAIENVRETADAHPAVGTSTPPRNAEDTKSTVWATTPPPYFGRKDTASTPSTDLPNTTPPPLTPASDTPLEGNAILLRPTTKKRRGCLFKGVVTIFIVFVVIVIALLQCDSEKSYTSGDGTNVVSPGENGDQPAAVTTEAHYDARAKHEDAPDWIQGNWRVETDFGGIGVKIKGRYLVETSGGETISGSFKYQNHTLFVDFGEREPSVYRLDEDRHRIDAGSGLWMEKMKE